MATSDHIFNFPTHEKIILCVISSIVYAEVFNGDFK